MIKSTFKFPVVVAGKTYQKAEQAWEMGQPLPEPKDGITYLVNVINFETNKALRSDLCMLDPSLKTVTDDGTKWGKTEYGGFLFSK